MSRHGFWNTKHQNTASRDSLWHNSTGPLPIQPSVSEILSLNPCLRSLVRRVRKVAHDLQQLLRFPCAADFISLSSWPSQLHSNQDLLRNANFAVVGCSVGLPIFCPTRLGHDVYICTSVHKLILHNKNAISIDTFNVKAAQKVGLDLIQVA